MAETQEYRYDVFISYSHADETWVEGTLLPRLEGAGLRVCIDFRDFLPGKAALFNMQDAVRDSRFTLLVLTPDWVNSEWTLFESLLSRTKDPAGLQRRTIPLRLQPCEPPDFISMISWVDFTRGDRLEIAWRQLLTGLGVPPEPVAPPEPERPGWFLPHPYGAQPNFTGRAAERQMLSDWLAGGLARPELVEGPPQPMLVLRALGGFGKSALAWHWLHHDVDAARWPRAVWWSFYEGDNQFDSFLRKTLLYLLGPKGTGRFRNERQLEEYLGSLGPRQQADLLLDFLRQPGTLLILDGFERALRAFSSMNAPYQGDEASQRISESATDRTRNTQYAIRNTQSDRDCISPIAEHFLRSMATLTGIRGKVLITTRLRPRILEWHGQDLLEGCCERELTQMDPADAVAFFRGQGIRGARAEVEAACAPYGYHPLSLRLLAGWIVRDLQQPGDIAAARRLDVSGDLIQRQHHVLEQAYESLTPNRQRLLSRIACFRGPVGYDALAALADTSPSPARERGQGGEGTPRAGLFGRLFSRPRARTGGDEPGPRDLDADLHDLLARGLLHRDQVTNRFDLHPIVRRYAYDRLAGDDRTAVHRRLRDYFAAVPPPERVRTLDDLAPVIELYHHTVAAGQYDEAIRLFRDRINKAAYFQFGAYQLQIELLAGLFPDSDSSTSSGQTALPRLKDQSAQSWTLNELANSYGLSGQPARAVPLCEDFIAILKKRGDKRNLAIGLGNLSSMAQIYIGALAAAEANLRRRIALCREIGDEFNEAIGHQHLGRLLAYRGAWARSEQELDAAIGLFEKDEFVQSQGVGWAYRALAALLMARDQSTIHNRQSAIPFARRALELADETARDPRYVYPIRDYIRAHWLLGAALRAGGIGANGRSPLQEADRHLTEALTRCRGINMVEMEADILLDLARVRWEQGGGGEELRAEALRLAEEALTITERSGYVLQGADVHLFLAEIEMERGDREQALSHAREARRLAACDGGPDYTYKVAYDEAGALLAKLEAA